MPLDRAHVTVASRIMLPAYALIYAGVGLAFLLQDPARTSSPAFDVAKSLLPIHAWGWVFLAVAVAETAALITHRRRAYVLALVPGAGLAGFWAVIVSSSAFASPLV